MTVATVSLTAEQERALAAIDTFMADHRRQVFVLDGLAGTGKTTLLAHIAEQYQHTALVTLTGKAASVLRRRFGIEAQTIHSFFYRLREARRDARGKQILKFDRAHSDNDLSGALVLLDESSMIDEVMGRDLVATGCKMIVSGDPGQLPPIKGRRFFDRPDFTLTEIHRQALQSPIIRQAHAVRRGGSYGDDGADFRVARNVTDDELSDVETVLCWTNQTRRHANRICRRARGFWQSMPQPGEPVMCLKNAALFGVFNGAVYTLREPLIPGDTHITLDVDGVVRTIPNINFTGLPTTLPEAAELTTTFDFGYAMTVHKAQGSEWEAVVLFDEYRIIEHRRDWLYTGITRAAQRLLIVRG